MNDLTPSNHLRYSCNESETWSISIGNKVRMVSSEMKTARRLGVVKAKAFEYTHPLFLVSGILRDKQRQGRVYAPLLQKLLEFFLDTDVQVVELPRQSYHCQNQENRSTKVRRDNIPEGQRRVHAVSSRPQPTGPLRVLRPCSRQCSQSQRHRLGQVCQLPMHPSKNWTGRVCHISTSRPARYMIVRRTFEMVMAQRTGYDTLPSSSGASSPSASSAS